MTLRPMRWWDIESVMAIERELFAATAWTPAQFWGELAQGNRSYLVAEDVDGIVAYAGLMVIPPAADIQTIAVAAQAQRRGLASAMLERLLATADAAGCTQTFLEVRSDNEAAIALYERAGFAPIARRTSYYAPGEDALVMRRDRPRSAS